MRPEFRSIVLGWTLINDAALLAICIHRAALWALAHDPLETDESAVIKLMID